MTKRMEDMSRKEILREFEGGDVVFRVPRRPKKLVPLTLRVHPDLVKRLGKEALRRGYHGHTTVARILIEEAIDSPKKKLAEEVADAVVRKMRRRKVSKG
ncbi:MAG: hypothetical protein AUJ18_08370 [Candidatus Hydrogenedentes bacterium CG1_02_42_14]|nr:MAG: hypothetical protein AUJ18_08370 [Candidatus Hydrogenedentes bacterium CG1_02_42_14]